MRDPNQPLRLGVAIPAYGFHLDVGHAAMWMGLGAALFEASDKVTLTSFIEYHINGVDLCRNTALHDALQADCDWLFMIDADTFHRSRVEGIADAGVDIIQMIRDADRNAVAEVDVTGEIVLTPIQTLRNRTGIGLVGAPVRGRGGDGGVCVKAYGSAESSDEPGMSYWTTYDAVPLDDLLHKVQPVGCIGGACIAVNCNWFRAYWPKAPWFEMRHEYGEGRPFNKRGEDYSICDGIWSRGGIVLCDGRFVPSHVAGRKLVGEETA